MGAETTEQTAGNAVDSRTTLFCVIGDPIHHSRSPLMLNRAFRETGVNGIYTAFHITADKLGAFIQGVRAMGIRGVNVTIPHKVEIMRHLDEIDASAQALGAVNTIVNDNGRLIGYNTDGIGYVRSLKEEAVPELAGKRIVLLGAGGAARGIVYALAEERPASMTIVNRTINRAEELAASVSGHAGLKDVRPVGAFGLEMACRQADVVINTTSVGMSPQTEGLPMDINVNWLKPDAVASEIIYNPMTTRFLREADAAGRRIHGGLGMFIYQGAYAFEYWTGKPAPVAAMRETVLEALGSASQATT
ncbi:shikimate dehydrogenase [Paenibacillus darwinianus]|uniref:Shikimate dehydrogenase (NADP(+)) n=1 Tax=Paenibacillus darwinianus TaxID=1380763 RepID=A0A9W5W6B0_9BACL|nr:shikimate dehydrogenase [Paenibacillus darwinianus]EXX86198.1 shikimate dehydrogenase [Paenibacillus darwinianus]EXX86559.1 shikimate dehydrogenase [Paenibacillus darwinianus]EXX89325.1 shikimate dehydrogenase [Paenibacillus darwinianus]